MATFFGDSPEYEARKNTPFELPKITIAQIHAAVPKHLLERSTFKSLCYVLRDIVFAVLMYRFGASIDTWTSSLPPNGYLSPRVIRFALWAFYWFWQGIILAGWWVLGHEAGHNSLSPYGWFNHTVGLCIHTFLLVPYFNWRSTHQTHHKGTGSIERDGTYIPRTRAYYKLPPRAIAHVSDYHDVFEETPIYTLLRMLAMQLLGWQAYLLTDAMGNPIHPMWTNHFSTSSPLFKPQERQWIIISNISLSFMTSILWYYARQVGFTNFLKLYFVPYLLANHWVVMLTFLHHSDPTIPHYRGNSWTFLRGALATVDRPLLGWIGRFFLHNVSHDHVAHHFFTLAPFYNLPEITRCIKPVLGAEYNYDSTNAFRALHRAFTECVFIEDDGEVLFYKNIEGRAVRKLAGETS
ncbi:delta-12 fatty acid desaturase [Phlebopus sp. FC_14]|nr:delta-12 fatty acid desaturase [Phlebopus sp. FC_14]